MARLSSQRMFINIGGGGTRHNPIRFQPGYIQRASNFQVTPRVSAGNPVAVRHFQNTNMMLNNRSFTRGFNNPSPSGYNEGFNQMRGLVHLGEGHRVRVRDAMNADLRRQMNEPRKVITIMRPGGGIRGGGGVGGAVGNEAWRAQQNAGLGRNKGYAQGMNRFAINSSGGSAGLNKMR